MNRQTITRPLSDFFSEDIKNLLGLGRNTLGVLRQTNPERTRNAPSIDYVPVKQEEIMKNITGSEEGDINNQEDFPSLEALKKIKENENKPRLKAYNNHNRNKSKYVKINITKQFSFENYYKKQKPLIYQPNDLEDKKKIISIINASDLVDETELTMKDFEDGHVEITDRLDHMPQFVIVEHMYNKGRIYTNNPNISKLPSYPKFPRIHGAVIDLDKELIWSSAVLPYEIVGTIDQENSTIDYENRTFGETKLDFYDDEKNEFNIEYRDPLTKEVKYFNFKNGSETRNINIHYGVEGMLVRVFKAYGEIILASHNKFNPSKYFELNILNLILGEFSGIRDEMQFFNPNVMFSPYVYTFLVRLPIFQYGSYSNLGFDIRYIKNPEQVRTVHTDTTVLWKPSTDMVSYSDDYPYKDVDKSGYAEILETDTQNVAPDRRNMIGKFFYGKESNQYRKKMDSGLVQYFLYGINYERYIAELSILISRSVNENVDIRDLINMCESYKPQYPPEYDEESEEEIKKYLNNAVFKTALGEFLIIEIMGVSPKTGQVYSQHVFKIKSETYFSRNKLANGEYNLYMNMLKNINNLINLNPVTMQTLYETYAINVDGQPMILTDDMNELDASTQKCYKIFDEAKIEELQEVLKKDRMLTNEHLYINTLDGIPLYQHYMELYQEADNKKEENSSLLSYYYTKLVTILAILARSYNDKKLIDFIGLFPKLMNHIDKLAELLNGSINLVDTTLKLLHDPKYINRYGDENEKLMKKKASNKITGMIKEMYIYALEQQSIKYTKDNIKDKKVDEILKYLNEYRRNNILDMDVIKIIILTKGMDKLYFIMKALEKTDLY